MGIKSLQSESVLSIVQLFTRNERLGIEAINRCDIPAFYQTVRESRELSMEFKAEINAHIIAKQWGKHD